MVAQEAGVPSLFLLPMAPALSSAVYNSGFRVILATLLTEMGPRSDGKWEVWENTQSSTEDYQALKASYEASLSSLVTMVGADFIMADWKSEPTSHLPFKSYLASLLLVGVGFSWRLEEPRNSLCRFLGPTEVGLC